MAIRISKRLHIFWQASFHLQRQQCCHYLSPAYRCDEAWGNRLDHPLVKNISPGDYFYDLDQKYKREGKISAIDVDLFINGIDGVKTEGLVGEVEVVMRWLRRSSESIHTLLSTPHAALRCLMQAHATDTILKILSDPMNYGVFPDHYIANLLMDNFLQQENYTGAARVASVLMLQEDFGPSLSQCLALASCYSYATAANNLPWHDYTDKPEEPEEEVKLRVAYLRNPYFDDHFDLADPEHVVGKTLAWVSPLVGGLVGASCEVLGWALYNKWHHLVAALLRLKEGGDPVAASVVKQMKEIVGEFEAGEDEARGHARVAVEQMECAEMDLKTAIDTLTTQIAAQTEDHHIQAQTELYHSWEKQRDDEFQSQLDKYQKKELLSQIEEKKKDLAVKEEVIFFFDNQEKVELLLPKRRYYPKKRSLLFPKKEAKKVDEGYIPPEV